MMLLLWLIQPEVFYYTKEFYMKYTFLTEKFYNDYPNEKYPQIVIKENRPYAHVEVELYNRLFCIPLRSNIDHPHAYFTNKREHCGLDYSKAIVVLNDNYIDKTRKAFLRPDEYSRLRGKDFIIKRQFMNYIELYKQAKVDMTVNHREDILNFSTLQYFEEYIYTDIEKDIDTNIDEEDKNKDTN